MERFNSPRDRNTLMGNPARDNASPSSLQSFSTAALPDQAVETGSAASQWPARQDSFSSTGTPHVVEHEVKRRLTTEPGCQFSSLVVRRIDGGVCLEGVVKAGPCGDGIRNLAQQIAGVENVLNHLVDCRR
ncbi:MAG: hypothetical protein KDA79_08455 [Planctomycetaceae bacterium]|nr:hypothetical protein [Planctomycetaceae bacterium]